MKAFLDTSVLVATFYAHHVHHAPSLNVFLRYGKAQTCCGIHSLAEVYSVLTGTPGRERVSGDQALLFLGNVRERLTTVGLTADEYARVLKEAASLGVVGGAIYDALLGHCALKAKAENIYTWNVKHFERLGTEIAQRAKTP